MAGKIKLYFTWDIGIDAEPTLYTIDVDKLRNDTSLSGKDEFIRLRLLEAIDSGNEFIRTTLQNDIYNAEVEGNFNLSNYCVKEHIRTLTLQSWEQP